MIDRLRFDILVSKIHGYSHILDGLFRSMRSGQWHDPRMRYAILADLRMISHSLAKIVAELERDFPPEE